MSGISAAVARSVRDREVGSSNLPSPTRRGTITHRKTRFRCWCGVKDREVAGFPLQKLFSKESGIPLRGDKFRHPDQGIAKTIFMKKRIFTILIGTPLMAVALVVLLPSHPRMIVLSYLPFPPPSRVVTLDEPFYLSKNQDAIVRDTSATIHITKFFNHPCPKNTLCVWSGQAVELALENGAQTFMTSLGKLPASAPFNVTVQSSNYRTYAQLVVSKK